MTFSLWRTISIGTYAGEGGQFQQKEKMQDDIRKAGMASTWGAAHLLKGITLGWWMKSVDLVRITVHDLGFTNPVTHKEVYDRAAELGLEICPAEVGPQLRLQYPDQPPGEIIHVAMKPTYDTFVDPMRRLFTVESDATGTKRLHTTDGDAEVWKWSLDMCLVFTRRTER